MQKRVIVGVDGSDGSRAALRWAAAEARQWGVPLVAIRGWEFSPLIVATSAPIDVKELEANVRAQLHDVVVEELGDEPGIDVEERAVEDSPVRSLLDAANPDDHIVVGSRGYGGFKGALLGSVSQQVVHYAPCPVTVVRESELHR